MSLTGSLVIFIIIWWIVFFSVLPIGIKSQNTKFSDKLEGFDKEILPKFVSEVIESLADVFAEIGGNQFDTENSMSLYQRVLGRLESMNPIDQFYADEVEYQEIPSDFIELTSRLDSATGRQVNSAYFPFEITGEQCVYFAKNYPDCHIRIECLRIGPHIMRLLALAGAKNVEVTFSNALAQDANIDSNQFDWACTLLQPQNVNVKEKVKDDEKQYVPLKGMFDPNRLNPDSVPARYKENGYLQHVYWALNKNGIAYMVTGKGLLFRSGLEQHAREILIKKNAIDAIIQLPPNLMSFCPLPLVLIILKKSKTNSGILFVDATDGFTADASRNRLTGIDKISQIVREKAVIPGISVEVSSEQIKDNDYSLNPQNYLHEDMVKVVSVDSLKAYRHALQGQLQSINHKVETLFSKLEKN